MSLIQHRWAVAPGVMIPACFVVTAVKMTEEREVSFRELPPVDQSPDDPSPAMVEALEDDDQPEISPDMFEAEATAAFAPDVIIDRLNVYVDVYPGQLPTGEPLEHACFTVAVPCAAVRSLARDDLESACEAALLALAEFDGATLIQA
jgi:hypothetical protein